MKKLLFYIPYIPILGTLFQIYYLIFDTGKYEIASGKWDIHWALVLIVQAISFSILFNFS